MPSYSQADRPIRITTTLGDDDLLLESFSGFEALSAPFEFHASLVSENPNIDTAGLIGKPATLYLRLADGSERLFSGLWQSLRQSEMRADKLVVYEGVLSPTLWFLSLYSDCRIYQKKSALAIVKGLFEEFKLTDYRVDAEETPEREYCVQYRETHLNFVSRLLEEEGLFYYFEYDKNKNTLVIADTSKTLKTCPNSATVAYSFMSEDSERDAVLTLQQQNQAFTAKVTLNDYNFEMPNNDMKVSLGESKVPEHSDYPGLFDTRDKGDHYAKLRIEELETHRSTVEGSSSCRAFSPGFRFTLKDHFRTDFDTNYVLTSVTHNASATSYGSGGAGPFRYTNSFGAIPSKTPYRPPRRTRKPIIPGPQTALVVGKSGEEIWVDKYGRVRVQFFWDRLGKKDESSSCWVRVAQIWAGKNWGWVTIPRIGQEVVVDFLEGDPDRPIIIGRVYNADQMPPYALPDNGTQSGIRTRSSKNGTSDNCNEIRFEDLKGSEMLTFHAEKDMDTGVENDDTQSVGNNRKITVKGTHTEDITKDTAITIDQGNHSLTLNQGNQTIKVSTGNQSTEISQGNQSTKISLGNQSTQISLGKSEEEAMQSIELKVGQSSVKLDQMGVTIKGMTIKIEGEIQVQVKGLMTQVSGDAMLTLKGGITMIN